MFRNFEPKLRNSKPNDFILICGPTVMNIIACVIFAQKHKRLNLLLYYVNSKTGEEGYKKRTLNLEDLK